MTNKNIVISIIIIVIIAVGAFFLIRSNQIKNQKEIDDSEIITGGKDEYGCTPSAGYTWCESKDKCLRTWEEECTDLTLGDQKAFCELDNGVWYTDNNVCEKNLLTKEECLAQDGVFNECASACRHDPSADVCTMQCVQTCTVPVVIGK